MFRCRAERKFQADTEQEPTLAASSAEIHNNSGQQRQSSMTMGNTTEFTENIKI